MTPKQELEMLATDCEELVVEAHRDGDKGLMRAMMSVVARLRFAIKRLPDEPASAIPDSALVKPLSEADRATLIGTPDPHTAAQDWARRNGLKT